MPQVFKSRRNILRAANKSKREHFTQESSSQILEKDINELTTKRYNLKTKKDAFNDYIVEFGTDVEPGIIFKRMEKGQTKRTLRKTINNIREFINDISDPTYNNISSVGSLPTETDQDILDSADEMIETVDNILIDLKNKKNDEQNELQESSASNEESTEEPAEESTEESTEDSSEEPSGFAPIKTFQKQWDSVVGSEGIQTCDQLNNARKQIFGLDPVNCESFQQAPKEFPNSKKKKDEDFTQDFVDLMNQLESKINTLIQATGSQGSYVTERNKQLDSLKSEINNEITSDTAFIGSMSDSLKATGSMISARIDELEDLKSDFDRISGSEVWN